MKPKYNLFYKSMIAFIVSAVFIAGCKHDAESVADFNSVNNSTTAATDPSTSTNATASALASSGLILDANFDGSSPFTGFTLANGQYCCSYSITQVSAPDGGAGGKSLRYDLRSTDAIVSGSKRAEIQLDGTDAPETSERWYGLRYWFEKYDVDNGAESILQWHDDDGTTPPLSIQVSGGRMNVCQSFLATGNTHDDLGATTIGKWVNIVMHVKWSSSGNGLLEVWRDGTKMISKTNVRTNSTGGSYMKIGINKWSWAPGGGSSTATERIFYIDNFKMGNESATYTAVDPSSAGGTTPPATNQAPVVSAGTAQTITLPVSSVTLKATASDPDGTIASYAWTKVSGSGGVITSPAAATTTVTGLTAGTYTYTVKVTDNSGATASSNITVTVNAATTPPPTNQLPVVSAGSAQIITLPVSSVSLRGTASDPDGTIASYTWTKVSGSGGIITSPYAATSTVTGLIAGTYTFNLKVTDNAGASANSTVNVTVNPAITVPIGGTRANLILDANFDGSNAFTGFTLANGQYCCSYSITQVNAPDGGASGKSLKFDLRSTDPIVSSSKRAEIQLAGTDAPASSERWYGLRYWMEKYDADNGAESIIQWHDQDGTTPPLSIQVAGGRMNVCQSFSSGNTHYDLGATTTGRWINIVLHVKWSTGNTGILEVWRDGTKIVSKVNVRTNSNGGSYMKLGINKWSWAPGGGSSTATQRILYIDNFRMGNELATYNDVAP